jgi:hypothetical protein
MEKVCGQCGQVFLCHQQERCWCSEVPVDVGQLTRIAQTNEDCLCPTCLGQFRSQHLERTDILSQGK